jgi:hypothetical protein
MADLVLVRPQRMRAASPILTAILFCFSCVVFAWADEDSARVFGTPDYWTIPRVLGYIVLVLQPWILLAAVFREHWFEGVVFMECAAAILVALVLLWLRRWRTFYRVATVFIAVVSFLLLFYAVRMHFAVVRAEQRYQETFGRELQ